MPEHPSFPTALSRAATLACPRCGSRRLFRKWVSMREECPHCGLHFEKDEGYWLGSVMINTGATEGLVIVVLVIGAVIFWPDVPWVALLVIGIALAVVFPVLFHPFSRTLWVATERQVTDWSDASLLNPIKVAPDRDQQSAE